MWWLNIIDNLKSILRKLINRNNRCDLIKTLLESLGIEVLIVIILTFIKSKWLTMNLFFEVQSWLSNLKWWTKYVCGCVCLFSHFPPKVLLKWQQQWTEG